MTDPNKTETQGCDASCTCATEGGTCTCAKDGGECRCGDGCTCRSKAARPTDHAAA